jgi:hypothetical protein
MLLAEQLSARNMSYDLADDSKTTLNSELTSKHQELTEIKDETKDMAIRSFILIPPKEHRGRSPYEAKFAQLNQSLAFNPTKFLSRQHAGQADFPAKAVSSVQSTARGSSKSEESEEVSSYEEDSRDIFHKCFSLYINIRSQLIITVVLHFILSNNELLLPHIPHRAREGIERSMDRGATTLKVGELMDKYGSDDSLGPLMGELGPFLQVQNADLVNLLEAAYNFYHFHSPSAIVAPACSLGALFSRHCCYRLEIRYEDVVVNSRSQCFSCCPISSLSPSVKI